MILDLLYLTIFILIGLSFPNLWLRDDEKRHKTILVKLLLFHFLIGFSYFLYTRNGGGDAWGYWTVAKNMNTQTFFAFLYDTKGTNFMSALNYFPAHIMNMSFFANTMFYSLIGYMGIVFFYITTIRFIPYFPRFKGYRLFPLIFFMPNLHFWSSGIGKDTISFFCIGMFIYSTLEPIKRLHLLIFSLLLSFLVRPHIVLFLVFSFGLAYLIANKMSTLRRIFFSLTFIILGIIILPTVKEYVSINENSIESFDQFANKSINNLNRSHTGSVINISSYPFPLKVFTFLYRPSIFDINSIPALIACSENLLLLFFSYVILKHKPIDTFNASPFVIKGLVCFLIIGTLAFSQSLSNLGIMLRMRNMFLPGLLMYILWFFSFQQQKYIVVRQKYSNRILFQKGKVNSI